MDQSTNSTQPTLHSLCVPPSIWAEIRAHLEEWLPNEGCGLLAGTVTHEGVGVGRQFYPGFNVLHSRTRFRMADGQLIDAFRSMRESDQRLLAIVHSHPRTAPMPSETDLNELLYPEAAMLIVGFGGHDPEPSAWLVDNSLPAGIRQIPFVKTKAGTDGCVSCKSVNQGEG